MCKNIDVTLMPPPQRRNLPNELTYAKGCEILHLTEAEGPGCRALVGELMSGSTTLVASLSFARYGQEHDCGVAVICGVVGGSSLPNNTNVVTVR